MTILQGRKSENKTGNRDYSNLLYGNPVSKV